MLYIDQCGHILLIIVIFKMPIYSPIISLLSKCSTHLSTHTHTLTHPPHTHTQKITQLEEVIDCQKDELQFTRDQIRQLTGGDTDSKDNSGGLSLPSNVSDTGPLKRQLIKLQHATKVR